MDHPSVCGLPGFLLPAATLRCRNGHPKCKRLAIFTASLLLSGVSCDLFGVVHLQLGEVDLARLTQAGLDVRDALPAVGACSAITAAGVFHFALAVDAGRAERQCVQPADGNLLLAQFALAVDSLFEPL